MEYISSSLVSVQVAEYELGNEDKQVVIREIWDADGSDVFNAEVRDVSVSEDGESFFVCDQEGKWTLVDVGLNLIARNEEYTFESIGRYGNNGVATAVVNGEKRYINGRMQVNKNVWEEFCDFSGDVAAVKKNGKWAFVSAESLSTVEEFPYLDIAINDSGYCVADNKAVVADESGYYILDMKEKKPVSENRFEELKAFNSKQPIAYREGKKWGFVFSNGEIMTQAMYEDARSYVNGYAAVKQNGLWGIVDKNNLMVVEPQFTDILNVLDSGYVYVRNEEGFWDQIIIDRLKYTK